jgi:hypothetical protein
MPVMHDWYQNSEGSMMMFGICFGVEMAKGVGRLVG